MRKINRFLDFSNKIENLRVDLKYATNDNFTRQKVDGYYANHAWGTIELYEKLKEVAKDIKKDNLGILIWDAYRPIKAVKFFEIWSQNPEENDGKKKHYPKYEKKELFELGFIASNSSHCRGSTVDLTFYSVENGKTLDMGTCFDFMDEMSHHSFDGLDDNIKKNRRYLKEKMEKHGFYSYENEWWHYTLVNEPFKAGFDFDII